MMTNKEKYQQAFSQIRVPEELSKEWKAMEPKQATRKFSSLAACAAVIALLLVMTVGAYAADIGGIQQTIKMWIRGEEKESNVVFNGDGTYELSYTDENGDLVSRGGGGIVYEKDGTERPLTAEEILEDLQRNDPEVIYEEDTVTVYWKDQVIDITDRFANGYAYILLEDGSEKIYLTVEYQNGCSWNTDAFDIPEKSYKVVTDIDLTELQ